MLIPSWIIISYKIIKYASISYKFYPKYYTKILVAISYKLFFITKCVSISYETKFQNKTRRKNVF